MKKAFFILSWLAAATTMAAQDTADTTDVFFRHLELNEVVITGLTGETRITHSPTPVSIISSRDLQSTAATNLIDAIASQPGVAQITTGSGISKPVIRGLGYNRIVTISDGIRQEGQQWGDEHGIEIDPQTVSSVEILKGPASLMYGSDAMAGVLLFHPTHIVPLGEMRASLSTEYQTNNGLFDYSLSFGGNQQGFVWQTRWSQKLAHAYKNRTDGYVPGSQFREQAFHAMLGLNKYWGFSHLTLGYYQLTPGIVEGERDELTGQLLSEGDPKTYSRTLPYQQVYHYKAVWDNSLNVGDNRLKATIGYQQNRRQEFEESMDAYGLYFRLHTLSYDVRYLVENLHGWKLAAGIGGMWQRSENLGNEYLIPAYRLFDAGIFVTTSHDFGPVHMEGGIRFDRRTLHGYAQDDEGEERFSDFHRHFNGLSGSIGAVWQATEQLNVRLNVARGFRAPNMSELGSNGEHEGTIRYERGNHELKAEHSLQADLGVDFSSRYVSAQLSLFANRIGNYIFAARDRSQETGEIAAEGLHFYRYEQGDARLLGFEAVVDLHPIHELHFENTFSYVNARQLDQPADTRYLPMTPAPRWTSELKYEFTHHRNSIFRTASPKLSLCNAYMAVQMECQLEQNHYYRADQTETRTPAYALWNLSAGTDLQWGRRHVASLYVTLQNVFDRVYQNHLSRLKYCDVNNATGRMGISGMGRNLSIRLVVPVEF